jgi:hypothetical protein
MPMQEEFIMPGAVIEFGNKVMDVFSKKDAIVPFDLMERWPDYRENVEASVNAEDFLEGTDSYSLLPAIDLAKAVVEFKKLITDLQQSLSALTPALVAGRVPTGDWNKFQSALTKLVALRKQYPALSKYLDAPIKAYQSAWTTMNKRIAEIRKAAENAAVTVTDPIVDVGGGLTNTISNALGLNSDASSDDKKRGVAGLAIVGGSVLLLVGTGATALTSMARRKRKKMRRQAEHDLF